MKIITKLASVLFICATALSSCSSDDNNETEVVETATLKTFTDINFSLDDSEGFDSGRYFSTETGKSYKKSQITDAIVPTVDLAFNNFGYNVNFFMSPNDSDDGLANGTTTSYVNYVTDEYTVAQFNALENGSDLDNLVIEDDGNSFPDSQVPTIVLFKNAAGKKGVIHVKSVSRVGYDPKIVCDIKIQN